MSIPESPGIDRLHELENEYELIAELGRGGTSIVYLAREKELGREVAIKVVRSNQLDDAEAVARLAREAKLVALLRHPNIVPLLGTRHLSDGTLALIMQHVPGRTLKSAIREAGPLPIAVVEHVLREVGSALDYAHRRYSIVHRDIKPENIYLDEECGRALLSDFGIARPGEHESNLTMAGTALGTPAYMSPEQIDGSALDGRSDLYSLGLVAYEMLTGEQPWAGCNLYTIIYKQKNEELPAVSSFRNDVPPQLQRTIAGLLHKDRASRWSDSAQFLAQLPAASIEMPDLAVRKREAAVEVPPSADSPTLRYQRAAAEVADTPPEPIEQKELPELPAAAVLVTPPEAEPEPAPVREPRPFEAPRPTRLKRHLPGRSYIVPDAAPVLAAATAPVPATIAETEVMPSRPNGIAARALSFAHVTKPRSRLVAATTVLLVLGASATVVAMIGRDKDPDLRANGSPIASSALTALAPGRKPMPTDSLQSAQPASELTSSAAQRTEEKAAEPRGETDEARQTNDEPVKSPPVDVVSKTVVKSVAAPVIPTFEPPAATASEPARDFKPLGNEPSKTSDSTTERTPENIDAAPVFTPYTIKPELKNRDAVQRSLSRNYPRRLREAGVGGTVMVWALVDESGKVVKSQVKDGSGIEVLDEAALKVADAMRFTPALNRDQKVRVWIELPLVFKAE